jgi:hypothetical protein
METLRVVTHYDSAAATHPALRELADLLRYRDLLRLMVVNIAKSRYKRSVLGVLWTLMNPSAAHDRADDRLREHLQHEPAELSRSTCCQVSCAGRSSRQHGVRDELAHLGRLAHQAGVHSPHDLRSGRRRQRPDEPALSLGRSRSSWALGHPFSWSLLPCRWRSCCWPPSRLESPCSCRASPILFSDFVEFYQVIVQALFFLTPIMYPVEILPRVGARHAGPQPDVPPDLGIPRAGLSTGSSPTRRRWPPPRLRAPVLALGWVAFTRRADELPYRI